MPSVPLPIRGAKEPVDSGRPYLKPSIKEKGKKSKSQKARKSKGEKKPKRKKKVPQEWSGKSFWSYGYPISLKYFPKEISSQKRDF